MLEIKCISINIFCNSQIKVSHCDDHDDESMKIPNVNLSQIYFKKIYVSLELSCFSCFKDCGISIF